MGTVPKYQCKGKCAIIAKPDPIILQKLEEEYRLFQESESKSLLKKYLSRTIFDNLKLKKSDYGATIYDCIRAGLANLDDRDGLYAADPDSYRIFADIFDPIIEDYHGLSKPVKQPETFYGDFDSFTNFDPLEKYVISIRLRCTRNIDQYPFNQLLTEDQYIDLEKKIIKALTNIGNDEFKGTYHALETYDFKTRKKLVEQKILYREDDKVLETAQVYRFWPTGRGIFYNEDRSFLIWVNEKDHIRIISLQNDGNFHQAYKRLINGLKELEKRLFFTRDERLGFLAFSPTNIGTSMKASVKIKIPKLAKQKARLDALVTKYRLKLQGPKGNYNPPGGEDWYNVCSKQTMGITEYEVMKNMYDGILEIIELEKTI